MRGEGEPEQTAVTATGRRQYHFREWTCIFGSAALVILDTPGDKEEPIVNSAEKVQINSVPAHPGMSVPSNC